MIDRTRRALDAHGAGHRAGRRRRGRGQRARSAPRSKRSPRSSGLRFVAPPPALCTDNAAMIAWAGIERLAMGAAGDPLDFAARPRWPLDPDAEPVRGAGVKA